MAITSDQYRDTLRHFPAGVTIVTVKSGDQWHGLTVSAFVSVSPTPPLILVVIDHRHTGHDLLEHNDAVFAVNILREDQNALSNHFAWTDEEERFTEGRWGTASTGVPILEDALAWLACTVYSRHTAGTYTIYIGEVQACHVQEVDQKPLVYWNCDYRKIT